MSWFKKTMDEVKKKIEKQAQPDTHQVLDDIRRYEAVAEPVPGDDYARLTTRLKNSASRLVHCRYFTGEAKLFWQLAYEESLAPQEQMKLIWQQVPHVCRQLEQRIFTVETERDAKAEYFSGHDYTRQKLATRAKALDSIRAALRQAVQTVDALETEYDDTYAEVREPEIEEPERLGEFYGRLVQGIRNFSSWQAAFAKIPDAASLAHTLGDYEQTAIEAEEFWLDWLTGRDAYFQGISDIVQEERDIYEAEAEYEHSGAFGRKPVFDFSRRGHRLEQMKDDLADREDELHELYYTLWADFKRQCNRILDACDELCEYVIVLQDCLEDEKENNTENGKKLEMAYDKGQTEIELLNKERDEARQVLAFWQSQPEWKEADPVPPLPEEGAQIDGI